MGHYSGFELWGSGTRQWKSKGTHHHFSMAHSDGIFHEESRKFKSRAQV